MGRQGWLTIRKVPVSHKKSMGNPYHHVLVEFLKRNRVCPACEGLGWKYPKDVEFEYEADTTVKYVGLESLEQLKENPEVRITDVVRDILEMELWGKRHCKVCSGKKFVSIQDYKEYKRRRRQRKQRGKTK